MELEILQTFLTEHDLWHLIRIFSTDIKLAFKLKNRYLSVPYGARR